MADFNSEAKFLVGNNEGLISNFKTLLDETYNSYWKNLLLDDTTDYEFHWDLEQMSEVNDTYYSYYYQFVDAMLSASSSYPSKMSYLDELVGLYVSEKILTAITNLRSAAFDMANSGKHGNYPIDMEEFNDEVECGFSDDFETWEALDGTILKLNDYKK